MYGCVGVSGSVGSSCSGRLALLLLLFSSRSRSCLLSSSTHAHTHTHTLAHTRTHHTNSPVAARGSHDRTIDHRQMPKERIME
uniref:Putative secreted peptide n=1 Tax=Anopheles braziliensis TaxID=58242 RepID=A0A2M3ZMP3_9DIPT